MEKIAKNDMAALERNPARPNRTETESKTSDRVCIIMPTAEHCNARFLRPGFMPFEARLLKLRLVRQGIGNRPRSARRKPGFFAHGVGAFCFPAMMGLLARANGAIAYVRNRHVNGIPEGWLPKGPGEWLTIRACRLYGKDSSSTAWLAAGNSGRRNIA